MVAAQTSKSEGPIPPPVDDSNRPDMDWQTKIAKAKEARKAAQEHRKGKPVTFASNTYGPT